MARRDPALARLRTRSSGGENRRSHDALHAIPRFKAVAPEDTIRTIRTILSNLGIFVIEARWFREKDRFNSLGLSMVDAPLASAGKGSDERFALASAYGEFMERLQNLVLINGNLLTGNQPSEHVSFADAVPLDLEAFHRTHSALLAKWLEFDDSERLAGVLSRSERRLHAHPYYNIARDTVEYLPSELMLLSVGSNGMCAGNTTEEALIQGLCEIFERFAFRTIYTARDVRLPVVPADCYRRLPAWTFASILRDSGFDVIVKDCSLDGSLPVAGVLLVKDGKARFNLGAAPDFAIALERCFLEILQGCGLSSLGQTMQPMVAADAAKADREFADPARRAEYQYFLALRASSGVVPPAVFDHTRPFDPRNLFSSRDVASRAGLRSLIRKVLGGGYDIYVRDVGFLGFPAYQVYIPGMSEMLRTRLQDVEWRLVDLPRARRAFFNLGSCGIEEKQLLIRTIEHLLEFPYTHRESLFETLHNLHLSGHAVLGDVDLEDVLGMLYFEAGEPEQARRVLERHVRRRLRPEQLGNPPPSMRNRLCVLRFFELACEGRELDASRDALRAEFAETTLRSVHRALKDPSGLARYFGIPECDECSRCSCGAACAAGAVRALADTLRRHIREAAFDHVAVRTYLRTLLDRPDQTT